MGRIVQTSLFVAVVFWVRSVYALNQTHCVQADPNFEVIKTDRYYDLNFANSQVDRIEPSTLQHDYYGGEKVNTECDKDLSSESVVGIVVGWKNDLLLAYGIIRDVNKRPIEQHHTVDPISGALEVLHRQIVANDLIRVEPPIS